MAHFRRKRPATRTRTIHPYPRSGDAALWLNSWPAWHDIIYHRRPARRRSKAITAKVLRGDLDPDEAVWDVHRTRPAAQILLVKSEAFPRQAGGLIGHTAQVIFREKRGRGHASQAR